MPLPRTLKRLNSGIIAETEVRPTDGGVLHAKVLVFDSIRSMSRFWTKRLRKGSLGRSCYGAVNSLMHWVEDWRPGMNGERRVDGMDPRYFCVIGLVKRHLSTEVVCHECVHAGFAYAKRRTKAPWAKHTDFDEEEVCYPAGRLTRRIVNWLHEEKLW